MEELFGNLENLFNEILEEFGEENVENRLLAEFGLLRVPKPKKVMWEVYNYDIEITEINSWTYNFVINARKIPEHLKTGTANCESAALHQARDNLKEWFRANELETDT